MIWVRKGFVHFLSLLLLVSLIGGAFAVSADINLTHPAKLEAWLGQSGFYSGVVTKALNDAQQSASDNSGAGRVSLGDPTVQKAVRSVFSPQLLKQYSSTFLNSNYAWLEGKASSPDFKIDLTAPKQQLAQQVGRQVAARVASLPACSAAQLSQLQATLNTDPLSIPCQLPSLSPQAAGTQAAAQIIGSSNFLNNPIVTANALNPNGSKQGQPYYQRLSSAPKLYRLGQKLPWIFGGVALVGIIGIIFVAPRKRRGVRRVGIVLLEAGAVLVASKFIADAVFNHLEKRILSNSSIGQLQQALTDFIHRVESQMVKVDLWFGVGFLILAVLILATLWLTRQKSGTASNSQTIDDESSGTDGRRPPLPTLKQPPRPRPPRLVQ